MSNKNWLSAQNALSTSAEEVASPNARRKRITIKNLDAMILVYVGPDATVDATTGYELAAGDVHASQHTWEGASATGEFYAIAASGTPSIAIVEEYD